MSTKKYVMNKVVIMCVICFSVNMNAQSEKEIHQKQAKQAVLDFFEGFHKGDTTLMSSVIDKNTVMQTIAKTKDGGIKTVATDISDFLQVIHNRPKNQKWFEKLLDFKIDANASIAQVWTPYEFYVNDQFSHCGVNIFQLFNTGDTWKIIAIADTRKKEGCN